MTLRILILLSALMAFGSLAHAEKFRNAYVSFDLPDNWSCQHEEVTWVCVSNANQPRGKEAVIVLTAKEAGPSDTIAADAANLKSPRTIPGPNGPLRSEVKHFGEQKFNGQPWLDSMHLHGELPNHYTRYLATVKDRLGILVTFTAHRKFYTKYSHQFARAIKSLAVVAPKDMLSGQPNLGVQGPTGTISGPIGTALPADMYQDEYPAEPGSGGSSFGSGAQYLGLLLILLAIVLYFVLVKKKKSKKKKSKKPSKKL